MSKMKAGWFKTARSVDGSLCIRSVRGKRVCDGLFAYSDEYGVHLIHEGSLLRVCLFPDWHSCLELSKPIQRLDWTQIRTPVNDDEFMTGRGLIPVDMLKVLRDWRMQVEDLLAFARSLSIKDFN